MIQRVRKIFMYLAVCGFSVLIAAGQSALAQTAGDGDSSKESRTAPETSVHHFLCASGK